MPVYLYFPLCILLLLLTTFSIFAIRKKYIFSVMEKEIFKNVDERNQFITKCYQKGIKYIYHAINKQDEYIVEHEKI